MQNAEAAESTLYIYCDAGKQQATPGDLNSIEKVRAVVKSKKWCGIVEIIEREKNLGLAASVIDGVTTVLNKHESVIVLEDDLVVSKYFLQFMNEALIKYRLEEKVISIHGYTYPVKEKLPQTFFLKGADCWGWATWKRGWDLFEPDGAKLLSELKKTDSEASFNFNNAYDYMKMLQLQVKGKNSSWAIRWYASAFLKDRLTLYPGKSLVQNIGTDGAGTHIGKTTLYEVGISDDPIVIKGIPVEHSKEAYTIFENYFRQTHTSNLQHYLMNIKYNLPF